MSKLNASGKNILFEKIEQEEEKSSILVSLSDVNPTLIYGKVLDTGDECLYPHDGDFVYVRSENVSKVIHLGEEYWIADEGDILVYVEGEMGITERIIKEAAHPPTHKDLMKEKN